MNFNVSCHLKAAGRIGLPGHSEMTSEVRFDFVPQGRASSQSFADSRINHRRVKKPRDEC